MRKQEKTVIAILGMHRSGTSLVGQMIHALGVPMGDNLLVANEHNERGYFEDSEIVKIHDELLRVLGRPWQSINSTLPLPSDWMQRPETKVARDRLRTHIIAELQRDSWAVKDPRMARFLPLWKELAAEVGFKLVTLLCVRSPREVAMSLAMRDHFPIGMGQLLWTIYNFEILDNMGSALECVLCYDDWFQNPASNLKRLAAALNIKLTDERCYELAASIVSAKLRHHVSKASQEVGTHAEFYRLLHQWANMNAPPQKLADLLAIIRDSRILFSPWHEAREEGYLAEAEAVRLAEQAKIIASAEDYLKAYQDTEQARIGALEAIKRVEQERDVVADQARDYLKAYQDTEQARIGALDAIKRVEQERDAVAGQAQEYLKAYQESEFKRLNSLCHRLYRLISFKWLRK